MKCEARTSDLPLAITLIFDVIFIFVLSIYVLLQKEGGEFEGSEGSRNRTEGLNIAFGFR